MKANAPTVRARCQHGSQTFFAIMWDGNGLSAIFPGSILPPPAIKPVMFPASL